MLAIELNPRFQSFELEFLHSLGRLRPMGHDPAADCLWRKAADLFKYRNLRII
jgi:hypothetical protein